MSKHTPGPWTVGNRYGNAHTEIAGAGYAKAVAYCWTHKRDEAKRGKTKDSQAPWKPNAEGEANAHLIAAAPVMYDALESAPVHRLDESLADFMERYKAWHREVRVPAIAKAEGRAS